MALEHSKWYVVVWPRDRYILDPDEPQVTYKHDCQDIQRQLNKMANGAFDGLVGVVEIEKEEE